MTTSYLKPYLVGKIYYFKYTDRIQSDEWEFDRPTKSEIHPTTKPVSLVAQAVMNSSHSGYVIIKRRENATSKCDEYVKRGYECGQEGFSVIDIGDHSGPGDAGEGNE